MFNKVKTLYRGINSYPVKEKVTIGRTAAATVVSGTIMTITGSKVIAVASGVVAVLGVSTLVLNVIDGFKEGVEIEKREAMARKRDEDTKRAYLEMLASKAVDSGRFKDCECDYPHVVGSNCSSVSN
jgi:hypothetical protein